MRSTFLPLSRPSLTDADISAVVEVLRSGWITTGPVAADLERRFAAFTGATGAVAASSGTAAMHLLLHALGIGPGDEVITPSMTWVSTVNLIVLAGATPVFVDVDRDTLLVSPDEIERRCTGRTKLIVPVHFAGAPADLDAIGEIASQRGIRVVEDAAHAIGTSYRGRRIGAAGTAVFSLHPIKNVTTGEGGMICSDDPDLLEHVRRLRFHGLAADAFDRNSGGRAPQAQVMEPGYKYNLPDMCAALGIGQLQRLGALNAARRRIAERYRRCLAGVQHVRPLADPDYPHEHAWHLFVVRLDTPPDRMGRDDFMQALKLRNIGTGLHFRAVHSQGYYAKSMDGLAGTLPATEWNSQRICSLPLFPDMTDTDVDDVVTAVREVLRPAVTTPA